MSWAAVHDVVVEAEKRKTTIGRYTLESEAMEQEKSVEFVREEMTRRLKVMQQSVVAGCKGERSVGGLVGGQALMFQRYMQEGKPLCNNLYGKAIAYSLAVAEANACMGVIVACPTAGSSGVVPGVLLALQEELGLADEVVAEGLAAAGAVGLVIAQRASVSGAQGGCQAECGAAAVMAAVAAMEMLGEKPSIAVEAGAMALKGMLGLVCDPVAGLVEVPCVKRNVAAAVQALAAVDMARAGIVSTIPLDEVIDAMGEIGKALPSSLRETAKGGLAVTPTGERLAKKIFRR